MHWEAVAAIAQLVGTIGVIIALVFLAVEVRSNTRVANAQARHSISEFVLRIAIFRAEHADRFAKLESGTELTSGDHQFRYWSHIQFLLHAETYFHYHALRLMPDAVCWFRATCMFPSDVKACVTGSSISAVCKVSLPVSPPATKTCPFCRSVDVMPDLFSLITPSCVQRVVLGDQPRNLSCAPRTLKTKPPPRWEGSGWESSWSE